MIYEWKCKQCGTIVDVERSLSEMDVGPTKEQLGCSHAPSDYVRIISRPTVPFETLRDRGIFERTHWKDKPNRLSK